MDCFALLLLRVLLPDIEYRQGFEQRPATLSDGEEGGGDGCLGNIS